MVTNVNNRKWAYCRKYLIFPQTLVSLSLKPQLLALSCDLFLKFGTMDLSQIKVYLTFPFFSYS